ncbi:MAG: response regulator, partial [Pseudomonadota bacterium]
MTARVLVVDDLLPNVRLLEAKLRAEYFEVLTALSGQEGIEIAIEQMPDIILLDVMMPG